jgi:hypothetical protein
MYTSVISNTFENNVSTFETTFTLIVIFMYQKLVCKGIYPHKLSPLIEEHFLCAYLVSI